MDGGRRQRARGASRSGRSGGSTSASGSWPGLALFILVLAPLLFWFFEHEQNTDVEEVPSAYLWIVRTLIEEDTAYDIKTAGGYLVFYLVQIAGISLVAFVSGAIASKLVTTVMNKGKGMGSTNAKGHVVICGWSGKGAEIIRELRAREVEDPRRIVVLANLENDPTKVDDVEFLPRRPERRDRPAARRHRPLLDGDRARRRVDAGRHRRRARRPHAVHRARRRDRQRRRLQLRRGDPLREPAALRQHPRQRAGDQRARSPARCWPGSAANPGLSRVVTNLVTHPDDQEFYRIPVPADLVGRPVSEALVALKERPRRAAGGASSQGIDDYLLNPPMDRALAADEHLLVISSYVRVARAATPRAGSRRPGSAPPARSRPAGTPRPGR